MLIIDITAGITTLIWCIVPFFQQKSKYFFYFLLLAVMGLYSFVAVKTELLPILNILIPSSLLLTVSLFKDFFKKNWIVLLISASPFFFLANYFPHQTIMFIMLILLFIVFLLLCFQVVKETLQTDKLNIVWVMLVLYQLSHVLKFIPILREELSGIVFFVVTNIVQILLGVFFIFAREDNPKMIIKIA